MGTMMRMFLTFLIVVSAASAAPGASYSDIVMADQPLGYWRLGEPSGTTATDASSLAGAQDGTYMSGVALGQPGAFAGDSAASFLGDSGFMEVSDPTGALFVNPTAAFTFEAWVKIASPPADGHEHSLVSKRRQDGGSGINLYMRADGRIGFNMFFASSSGGVSAGVEHTTQFQGSDWHHLVGTYDGSAVSIYVDGQVTTAAASAGVFVGSAQPLYIGRELDPGFGYGARNLDGLLDEVAVYDYALTAQQVLTHFGATTAVPEPGLITLACLGLAAHALRFKRPQG